MEAATSVSTAVAPADVARTVDSPKSLADAEHQGIKISMVSDKEQMLFFEAARQFKDPSDYTFVGRTEPLVA